MSDYITFKNLYKKYVLNARSYDISQLTPIFKRMIINKEYNDLLIYGNKELGNIINQHINYNNVYYSDCSVYESIVRCWIHHLNNNTKNIY